MCQDSGTDEEIPLPNVKTAILSKAWNKDSAQTERKSLAEVTQGRTVEQSSLSVAVIQVIDYCKYHKDNPPEEIQKPLKSTNLVECGVSEWDSEYVNIEQEAEPLESSSD